MRVDLYGATTTTEATTQASKINGTSSLAGQKATSAGPAETEDTTNLSSSSASVQALTQAALQPIPSRATKVEALKLAVSSAQYQLDAVKIAESLANSDV